MIKSSRRLTLLKSKSLAVRRVEKFKAMMWSTLTLRMIWERLRMPTLLQKTGRIVRELSSFAPGVSLDAWDILLRTWPTWSPTRRWSQKSTGRTSRMLSMRCASRSRATTACSLSSASRKTSSCGFLRAQSVRLPNSLLQIFTRVTSLNLQVIAWSTADHSYHSIKASKSSLTCDWWKNF